MMFFSKITTPLLTAFILLQWTTQCNTQALPRIAGTVTLAEGWKPMLYLVQPRTFAEIASSFSGTVIDSARIGPDCRFAFSNLPQNEENMLLEICIERVGGRYPNQLLDDNPLIANYMPLVLTKGAQIDIVAEAGHFQASFSIEKPSPENQALLQLRDIRHKAYAQQQQWLDPETDHADESTLLAQEAALRQFRLPLMAFADSISYLRPALVAVRWVSPAGDYERVPEFLYGQCQKWRAKADAGPWSDQLCQAGSREKLPVLTGDKIPDYPLPMSTGDTILLDKLLGSRLTVLDIWASWCMPCRRENREVLSPLWNQYQDKGLQILGYSIDSSPAAWKAAIAKDGAAWPHASHLSGDATPFLGALRITTIPANFILDAQGAILAKNLHGADLKAFVAEYFSRH